MKKLILLLLFVFLSCGEVSRNFIEPTKEQLETISSGFTENIVVEDYCAINIKPVYDGVEYDDYYFIALRLSREYKTLNTKESFDLLCTQILFLPKFLQLRTHALQTPAL